jgi:hypothetical protein
LTTGYGNIARHFGRGLLQVGHDVGFASLQHVGEKLWYRCGEDLVPHYGANPIQRLPAAVKDFAPDLVLHIRDVVAHIAKWWPSAYSLRGLTDGVPVWGWTPVQHLPVPWDYVDAAMREYDRTLVFTRAGRDALCNAGHMRNLVDALMPGVSPAYAQRQGPAADVGRKDVPLVMTVGVADQPRKMYPILMRAYKKILGRVDLDFYLHTLVAGAYDLLAHINELGVQGHWLFPASHNPLWGMPEEEMARHYRRATAYAAVGTGEGLNLPLMEAAAMGRYLIYPSFPNNEEVVHDYGGISRAVKTRRIPLTTSWEWVMDEDDLAAALERVPAIAKELGTAEDQEAATEYYDRHSWRATVHDFLAIAEREGLA